MKAMLIVALMGMAQPHQVVYDSMEQCIASKAVVEKQQMVEGAACVPHQNIAKQLEDPMKIILGFMKQVKQRHKCEDMQNMILLKECMKKPTKFGQTMHDPSKLPERPWPEGQKVPCRCDILAMPYDLCLKGIGREECFKKEKPEQSSEAPKVTLPEVVDPKNFQFKRVTEAPKTVPFVDPDKKVESKPATNYFEKKWNLSEAPKQAARAYEAVKSRWSDYSETKKWKW